MSMMLDVSASTVVMGQNGRPEVTPSSAVITPTSANHVMLTHMEQQQQQQQHHPPAPRRCMSMPESYHNNCRVPPGVSARLPPPSWGRGRPRAPLPRSRLPTHPAEKVDQACRFFFPLGFFLCNSVYWLYYLEVNDGTPK